MRLEVPGPLAEGGGESVCFQLGGPRPDGRGDL